MNKFQLQSNVKSTGTAYLFWFLLGAHYAYLGKWGIQILYWITLGGLGFWALIDLFLMSSKVNAHNAVIFAQLEKLEKQEREDDLARSIAISKASK